MATVYQAVDERLGRTVAIKIMHTQLAQGPQRDQFVERFHREARSAAAIANPHIVQVYDTGEFDGLDFLVMEYVHGVNLRYEMNQQVTFSVRETLRIVGETLDGLASAHRAGVVHRDIKPENILLNDRGHVQITDFGLAKAVSQATLSSTGMLLGTAAYLAPEMIQHNQATPQGDLYSVGIMAWEMLAGKVPFTADNPVTLVFKHVHEDVPDITTACPGINAGVAAFLARLTRARSRTVPRMRPWHSTNCSSCNRTSPSTTGNTVCQPFPRPQTMPPTPCPAMHPADAATARSPSTACASERRSYTTVQSGKPEQNHRHAGAAGRSGGNHPLGFGKERRPRQQRSSFPFERSGQWWTAETQWQACTCHHRRRSSIVLACAGGGGYAWWYFRGPGSYWTMPQPADLTCSDSEPCRISNIKWNAYEELLKFSNIEYEETEAFSDSVKAGNVISTDPENVGSHVSKRHHQKVKVVVSKGIKQGTVPTDILDATSANGKDPINALKRAGFDNIEQTPANDDAYSMDVPQGALLDLSVDPGATLPHNAKITVTLSQGPKPVTMPDVVGKSKDEAQQTLDALKLTVNWTEQFDDKIPQGR